MKKIKKDILNEIPNESERIISLDDIDITAFWGVNEKLLNFLRLLFPKVKIVVRGEMVKLLGEKNEIEKLEKNIHFMVLHFEHFGKISEKEIMQIIEKEQSGVEKELEKNVLVHGNHGLLIKARTENQQKMVDAIAENDMVFAIGPAGSGKTYTAVALAVRALKNREVRRIILTRPAVEAGENLGFLPGDLRDKLDPYLQPLYDALRDMIPTQKLLSYLEENTIEIAPLAFMRGRTLDNAFVILDEAQNATESQMKMFLTRMGRSAKFIITGDVTQIDLPKNQQSGLIKAEKILQNIEGLKFIYLTQDDIIRHRLVTQIVKAYEKKD